MIGDAIAYGVWSLFCFFYASLHFIAHRKATGSATSWVNLVGAILLAGTGVLFSWMTIKLLS